MEFLYNRHQLRELSQFICNSCLKVEKGSFVILEGMDVPPNDLKLVAEILSEYDFECIVLNKSLVLNWINNRSRTFNYLSTQAEFELSLMKKAKAFIGLRCPLNTIYEVKDNVRKRVIEDYIQPVHFNFRNKNLQWLYCRLPTSDWISETISVDDYFKSIQLDFTRFEERMSILNNRIANCSIFHFQGANTSLRIENSGQGVVNSVGRHNLPDGEVFFSPEKRGIHGKITFNIPSFYWDNTFENISLTFKNGKVIESDSTVNSEALKSNINFDSGSAYCGEVAFGLNPFVRKSITDILYDEKMHGSFHIALGNAYPESDNGNRSGVHWDLIQDMRKDATKVYFDEELIMENGTFVPDDLKLLNISELKDYISYEK